MAGRIDQIQAVFVAVARGVMQANAFGFDGDAALALEVHRIEHLRGHFALGERAGEFEQAVGQRGFAVVDVRDDAEIADELGIHGSLCVGPTITRVRRKRRLLCARLVAPCKLSSLPHKDRKSKLEMGRAGTLNRDSRPAPRSRCEFRGS